MKISSLLILALAALLLSACTGSSIETPEPTQNSPEDLIVNEEETELPPTTDYSGLEIITLLPKDAIPAIDDPNFLTAADADLEYAPDEFILGVVFNGEARAYSVSHLSRHEIVNDTVGGVALAVTW
jgi:hypothetical protein